MTAAEVISGLELTQKNYNIAINLLKERYGKKQNNDKGSLRKINEFIYGYIQNNITEKILRHDGKAFEMFTITWRRYVTTWKF